MNLIVSLSTGIRTENDDECSMLVILVFYTQQQQLRKKALRESDVNTARWL